MNPLNLIIPNVFLNFNLNNKFKGVLFEYKVVYVKQKIIIKPHYYKLNALFIIIFFLP